MTFVEIDGPKEKLRPLYKIPGLDLSRGFRDLGGGVYRANGAVLTPEAMVALRATGVAVRVTLDEAEVERRVKADHEMTRRGRREYAVERAKREAAQAPTAPGSAQKPDGDGGSGKP